MNETKKTGMSIEELSATNEWQALRPNLKRLLTLALQSRNLTAAISELHRSADAETPRQLAEKLLQDSTVQAVVNLYSVGVAAAPQLAPVQPVFPTTPIPPVVEVEIFSDAKQVVN